jgi:hypothetical protein
MDSILQEKLFAKYPKIFGEKDLPMTQTCMCWGIETDNGWYNILDRLCSNIQWYIDSSVKSVEYNTKHNAMVTAAKAGDWTLFDEQFVGGTYTPAYLQMRKKEILTEPLRNATIVTQVVASQVKEKFGALRFYYNGGDDVIDGMVGMAEAMSGCTCEACGNIGRVRSGGWMRTLCDEHAEKAGYNKIETEEEDTL